MKFQYILTAVFACILAASYLFGLLPPIIALLYVLSSLITFTLYAKDKSSAIKGTWRIPEFQLHTWSLLFGWPGALSAQQAFRHKTKKRRFQIIFWLTVMANIGMYGAWHSHYAYDHLKPWLHDLTDIIEDNVKNEQLQKSLTVLVSLRKT